MSVKDHGTKEPIASVAPRPKANQETLVWVEHTLFTLLVIPVVASILLLVSEARQYEITGHNYTLIDEYRTSIQIAIHVASTIFGAIQIYALCRLINLGTRISLTQTPISLNVLALWTSISTLNVNWNLPFRMTVVSVLFYNLCAALSALWTGALTPALTTGFRNGTVMAPSWVNTSLIVEYPSQIDRTGRSVRSTKGSFSYSVGMGLLGSLVSSASSATTVDGSVRNHSKLDNTGYNYHGRSYGAGSTAGLLDSAILNIPFSSNYSYQEIGYETSVSCSYNDSARFVLTESYSDSSTFSAQGWLPDSPEDSQEESTYIGWGESAIVAMGVSQKPIKSRTRYVGIAAGSYYDFINSTQCAIHFAPALFNVSVGIRDKSIKVRKARTDEDLPFIDPSFMTIHVATRQLELISNDLTSMYRSPLGDAFNSSINDHRTRVLSDRSKPIPSSENITLTGLENAITSFMDDIMVGYASAQLMVGGQRKPTEATAQIPVYHLGSSWYIITVAGVNAIIVLYVVFECIRTRAWKHAPPFDYLDNRALIAGTSRGGTGIANYADSMGIGKGEIPVVLERRSCDIGSTQFTLCLPKDRANVLQNHLRGSSESANWI